MLEQSTTEKSQESNNPQKANTNKASKRAQRKARRETDKKKRNTTGGGKKHTSYYVMRHRHSSDLVIRVQKHSFFLLFFFLSYTKKYFVRYEISRESHRTSIHNINPMNGTGYRSIEMVCTLTDPNRNPSEPFFSKKKYEPLFFTNRYIDWGGV